MNHNRVLHSEIAFLHFRAEETPRVTNSEKVEVEKLGGGFHRIVSHYGFMEEPTVAATISLAREKGSCFSMEEASFFLGRERLSLGKGPGMSRWRATLFRFMSRNAMDAAAFFNIQRIRS